MNVLLLHICLHLSQCQGKAEPHLLKPTSPPLHYTQNKQCQLRLFRKSVNTFTPRHTLPAAVQARQHMHNKAPGKTWRDGIETKNCSVVLWLVFEGRQTTVPSHQFIISSAMLELIKCGRTKGKEAGFSPHCVHIVQCVEAVCHHELQRCHELSSLPYKQNKTMAFFS